MVNFPVQPRDQTFERPFVRTTELEHLLMQCADKIRLRSFSDHAGLHLAFVSDVHQSGFAVGTHQRAIVLLAVRHLSR